MSFKIFKPLLAGANFTDRLIACVGATICLALTMVVCAQFPLEMTDLPIIVAPLGASAVLVFGVPSSPLAQPWPVIGGNVISTMIGVAMFQWIPDIRIAAGAAVGAAILVMSLLRCLHPPGGAAALTAVIGSQSIHSAGYSFALAPVGINSLALVLLAVVFHRMTAKSYPHKAAIPVLTVAAEHSVAGLHTADIDATLAEMHESFDISREDLDLLLTRAEHHAAQRRSA